MRSFAHDRLVFDVKDEGPEVGPAVVLLHGFPQDSTCWDSIVVPLHEQGYRTLALDLRGYSPGARPKGARNYSLAAVTGDVVALLDAAGLARAHVVGHDWGGMVAWALAASQPGRVETVASLSTPHPAALRRAMVRSTQAINSTYMLAFQLRWLPEQVLHPGGPAWDALIRGMPAHQARYYTERMEQPGALTAALNWYRAMPREVLRPSVRVGRVRVPALYVWGDRDPALGRAAAVATSDFAVADYTFTILRGVGHWIPERAPGQVVDSLLEFWSREPHRANAS
jgi:pimeloyl-ACP methyl ester carboxylesterase